MPVDPNAAKAMFMTALDRSDPAERAAYLDQACGGDAALRRRVEALLASHDRAADYLERPALEQLAADVTGDRRVDVVAANKKGVFVLRQR